MSRSIDSARNLKRHVGWYSLAAAAAGVSLLALAQPAAGEVVVTKKTIAIPLSPIGMPDVVRLSMANNGADDFDFWLYNDPTISDRGLLAYGGTSRPNAVMAGGDFYAKELALARGASIGPSPKNIFSHFTGLIEATETGRSGRYSRGYWGGNIKDHYLGVRFVIDGELHYGWIRLTVTPNLQMGGPFMTAQITAYAYETEANTQIFAGLTEEPAAKVQAPQNIRNQRGPALGMLAAGADGLPLWRREANARKLGSEGTPVPSDQP